MEEGSFHAAKAEGVEDESEDVDSDDRCQFLGRMKLELRYLDLGGQEARAMEEDDRDYELVKQVEEREIGGSVQYGLVAWKRSDQPPTP